MRSAERFSDAEHMIAEAIRTKLADVWTSLPGYVLSVDLSKATATVQIGVRSLVTSPDLTQKSVEMPVLTDVPLVFPRGGGCTLTFPVSPGDECQVVFAARSIDAWHQSGGIQDPTDSRRHSLSDAFCYVGPMSVPNVIGGISTSTTQLRSDDGSTYIELNAQAQLVNVVAPGGMTITAPTVHISGTLTADEDVLGGGISLKTHTHSGVQSGGGTSGPPVP